jgi:hypothetical protein
MNKPGSEFDQNYGQQQICKSHHPLRQWVKGFYLTNILQEVTGATIDFGCGAGQLLARLPEDSLGLEVNPFLVEALQNAGLNVQQYDFEEDQLSLRCLQVSRYQTLVMAHVLEHMADAANFLRVLLASCRRLGISRVILILPTEKGFRSDSTHKTFVDKPYLEREGLLRCQGYIVTKMSYFPLNISSLGKVFVYHELKVIYDLGV